VYSKESKEKKLRVLLALPCTLGIIYFVPQSLLVWIILSVDDGKGGKAQWSIEGRTPGQLVRAGWSKTTLKTGETITVDFSPAKDGSPTGLLTRVRRADGTVVGDPAPPATQ